MQITTLPKDDVKRGEIYYISRGGYNTGSEQQADRPGVIVSNDKNNKNSQTLEVVYLTTQPKNELPTHCTIRSTGRVSTVLCEQIHTVAVERIGKYIGVCTAQEMQNIDIGLMISIGLGDAGGATKDKTVVTDQKEFHECLLELHEDHDDRSTRHLAFAQGRGAPAPASRHRRGPGHGDAQRHHRGGPLRPRLRRQVVLRL